MRFYNYEKLCLLSMRRSNLILRYFKEHNIEGISFIRKEGIVTDNPFNLSDRTLAEYLGLCALRNYPETHLSLDKLPPWIPLQVVKENPLVKLTENEIKFIHEEK